MKKIYSLILTLLVLQTAQAQRASLSSTSLPMPSFIQQPLSGRNVPDTLTGHFTGTVVNYTSDLGGYIAGHNGYLDKAKMQLFDSSYGVTGAGFINSILFWFGHAEGNPAHSFTATIWDNAAGTPGNILATVTVPFSAIDTAVANWVQVVNASDTVFYNAVATFSSPVPVPAGGSFWAGFSFTYLSGDTIAVVTTSDLVDTDQPGVTGDFPDAVTHTWEQWDDNSYYPFNDGTTNSWLLDIALGIFPAMNFTVGINEVNQSGATLYQNYPNPFNGTTSITYHLDKREDVRLTVTDVAGRIINNYVLGNKNPGTHTYALDATFYEAGIYFVMLKTGNGSQTRTLIVTK